MYGVRNIEKTTRFSLKSRPSERFHWPEMSQIKAEISHVDHPLTPPPPLWTDMVFSGTLPPPSLSTWFMNDPLSQIKIKPRHA